MAATPLAYRLRVRNEDDTDDELVITSLRTGTNPYIKAPPVIDAQGLDPVAGRVTIGQATLQVIDAVTETESEQLVASDGFEYADLTALNAAWPEADTLGALSTWSIETSVVKQGARAAKLTVIGAASEGQESTRSHTFSGLTPNATHRLRLWVWLNEEFGANVGHDLRFGIRVPGQGESVVPTPPGNTINAWTELELEVTADPSGEIEVEVGAFDSSASVHNRLSRFDDLRLYEVLGTDGRIVTSKLTDEDGRRNLLGHKTIIEESTDSGSNWDNLSTGFLTGLRLVSTLVYDFTVSDTPLDRARQKIFQFAESGDGYDFSRVSCILGGPVIGNFGPLLDLGRPKFKVASVGIGGFDELVALKWIDGGGPISEVLKEYHPGLTSDNRAFLNSLADPYKTRDGDFVTFSDLICRLFDEDEGPDTTVGIDECDFTPIGHYRFGGVAGIGTVLLGAQADLSGLALINYLDTIVVRWPTSGAPAQPSVGDVFRLAVFPQTISPQNPVHVIAHPVALAAQIASARGVAFTSASVTAITNALGPDLLPLYRIPGPMSVREALEKLCFGPFGFAWRQTETGEYEFILARPRSADGPVGTIELNDLANADGVVWEDSEPTQVDTVIYTVRSFAPLTTENRSGGAIDYLSETTQRFEVVPNDLTGLGNSIQQFDIPADLRTSRGTQFNLVEYFAALGQEMFAVYRHGAPTGTIQLIRGATDALLGDELILNLPHRPGRSLAQTPTTQRGSPAMVVQILQRQPIPSGLILKVQDRGTAETTDTEPEFTLAASVSSPKKVVTVTITNPIDLVSAGITSVRVEMALGSPTGYVFVRNWIPGTDDAEFDLPAVDAGSVVNVRMRSEITGRLPGSYTSPDSINLTDLAAPSSLSTSVSGTQVTMAWTVGEADQPVEVLYKRDSDSTYTTAITLAAGSVGYVLTLPDASQNYTVGVRHREAPPFGGVSATVTDDISTGTADTLDPPINPAVFSDGAGRYGLEVTATEFPSDTVFAEAVETAVGSGTPGTYTDVGRVPSQQAGRTRLELGPVPNDGKLRYLKVRHTRNGADDSTETAALAVDPWAVVTPTQDTERTYVTVDADPNLPNSRRLVAGAGIALTDGGPGSTLEVAIDGMGPAELSALFGLLASKAPLFSPNFIGNPKKSGVALATLADITGSAADSDQNILASQAFGA